MKPMKNESVQRAPLSPQFAGAVFFAIFSLLFVLFTKYMLLSLKDSLRLPLLLTLFSVIGISACIGALLGNVLAKPRHWFRLLLIGFSLAILAIVLASLGILLHACYYQAPLIHSLHHWQDYVIIYGVIVVSVTLIVGVWLIPATGLATIYFNKHFLPGLIAVDKQRMQSREATK